MKRTKLFSLILATLLAFSAPAMAETAIHAGGYSYHVATGHKNDYNDWHRLAAFEHGSVMAGYFRNSYDRDTFLAAYGWSHQWGNFRGAVHVGASYGYRSCYGDEGNTGRVCPVAFPSLYYTRYAVQPGVVVFGEAVAVTVRWEL
jgi:hypothetical protein